MQEASTREDSQIERKNPPYFSNASKAMSDLEGSNPLTLSHQDALGDNK